MRTHTKPAWLSTMALVAATTLPLSALAQDPEALGRHLEPSPLAHA